MEFSLINDVNDLQEGIVNVNVIPIPREVTDFWQALKQGGYISRGTRIEDFAVLFGRPLGIEERPYNKIKWMAAKYLLYEFVDAITRGQAEQPISLLCWLLFEDKRGNSDCYKKIRRRNGIEFDGEKMVLFELIEKYLPKWLQSCTRV